MKAEPDFYLPINSSQKKLLTSFLPVGQSTKFIIHKSRVHKQGLINSNFTEICPNLSSQSNRRLFVNRRIFWESFRSKTNTYQIENRIRDGANVSFLLQSAGFYQELLPTVPGVRTLPGPNSLTTLFSNKLIKDAERNPDGLRCQILILQALITAGDFISWESFYYAFASWDKRGAARSAGAFKR